MHPIYNLKPAIGHPQPPEYWSYSSLRLWRTCPRRWWLERCSYPNSETRVYPVPLNAGAIEGQLVHQVVQEWGRSLRQGDNPGSMRNRLKAILLELRSSLKENPRVDPARIISSVSLDACVAKAFEFVRDLEPQEARQQARLSNRRSETREIPPQAEEFWIVVDDPPLKGQLDRVRNGIVTDYKTGAPESIHEDQLLFYAVLWWLKYEELPVRLELRYPQSVIEVPVPGLNDIARLAANLRSEIGEARIAIERGFPSSRPAADTCRHCPVRQLCDDYWRSSITMELRLANGEKVSDKQSQVHFGDVQLSQVPTERRSDGAISGEAIATDIGSVHVHLGAHYCPPAAVPTFAVRLLGAKLTRDRGEQSITTVAGTEAFWIEELEPTREETFQR